MSIHKSRLQTIKGIALLILFVSYSVGISYFPHKHIIDGKVVVHSHPFSATEHHTHSTGTVQLIQLLSAYVTQAVVSVLLVSVLLSCIHKLLIVSYSGETVSPVSYRYCLRPPPAL